jgi:hypothetical protein
MAWASINDARLTQYGSHSCSISCGGRRTLLPARVSIFGHRVDGKLALRSLALEPVGYSAGGDFFPSISSLIAWRWRHDFLSSLSRFSAVILKGLPFHRPDRATRSKRMPACQVGNMKRGGRFLAVFSAAADLFCIFLILFCGVGHSLFESGVASNKGRDLDLLARSSGAMYCAVVRSTARFPVTLIIKSVLRRDLDASERIDQVRRVGQDLESPIRTLPPRCRRRASATLPPG